MVPYDQGPASLEMIKRFMDEQKNGGSLCRPFDTTVKKYDFIITFCSACRIK
jgi:hypothetical protein